MKGFKKYYVLFAASIILPLVITLPAFGQQKFVLKFNHVLEIGRAHV